MAAVGDCFSIGSIVVCKTCFDQTVEGEVLAFDQQTKMLILINLECRSKNSEKLNDVYILNLQFCSDVQVKKEVSANTDTPQSLNLNRLKTRLRNTLEKRQRWADALAAGASPEAQRLYMAVAKMWDEKVTWQGPNIVVFNEVTISPPYKVDNVTACNPENTDNTRLLNYVKKMVDQFFKTQAASAAAAAAVAVAASGNSNSSGSSASTATASTSNNNPIASTTVGTSSNNVSASPVPAN